MPDGDGVAEAEALADLVGFADGVGVGVAEGLGVLGCGAVMHQVDCVTFVSRDL